MFPSADSSCKEQGPWAPAELPHLRVARDFVRERQCQQCPAQPCSPLWSQSTSLGAQTSSFKKKQTNISYIIQTPLPCQHLYNVSQEGLVRRRVCDAWKLRGLGKALALLARGNGHLHVATGPEPDALWPQQLVPGALAGRAAALPRSLDPGLLLCTWN